MIMKGSQLPRVILAGDLNFPDPLWEAGIEFIDSNAVLDQNFIIVLFNSVMTIQIN